MDPALVIDLKTIGVAAVIAWGVTETIKPLMKRGGKRKSATRALALLTGTLSGAFIYPALGGEGGGIVGGGLGAAAGALNAVIVALVKSKVKAQEVPLDSND
jgi:hypothetical protein